MNESAEHYFTTSPESKAKPRTLSVSLGVHDVEVVTLGGVFSPEQLDRGTDVLLRKSPPVDAGPVLDIGSGWGPIALSAALDVPEAAVWAVDVNERARDLTRDNAERLGLQNVHVVAPDEVPPDVMFAEIRSNPPIRVGKEALHGILSLWLPRLMPGGCAYLVVGKHLGADSLQRWIAATFPYLTVDRYARDKGFHIIRAERE